MPRVGLLSDSHGDAAATRRGVRLLIAQRAQTLLHLGDVGTTQVIDELLVEGIESRLVFGNTDMDIRGLTGYARDLRIAVDHPVGRLTWNGKSLAFTHGHRPGAMTQALQDQVHYLCHGHTHETRDDRHGRTRIINPGALFRATRHTVAILDTDADVLSFHCIDDA